MIAFHWPGLKREFRRALLANLIANMEKRVFRATHVGFLPIIGSGTSDNGDGADGESNPYSDVIVDHRRK